MPKNNHASPLPTWRKGQQLHRFYINQVVDHANALGTITGGPGVAVTRTGNGVAISLAQLDAPIATRGDSFFAKITSASGGAHAWTEMIPNTEGSFVVRDGGQSGTTSANPAYEINGRAGVPANTIVKLTSTVGSDGQSKFTFDLGAGNHGSAASLAYSGEHADAADSNSWSIANQTTERGVNVTVQTGSRYDSSAETPKLYAYLRTLSFDANGQLFAISAESRVIIDTPEACS